MQIMAIPEGEERTEEIFEVLTAENFLKLLTNTKPQIQESHRIPRRMNTKKSTPKCIYYIQTGEKSKTKKNLERSYRGQEKP